MVKVMQSFDLSDEKMALLLETRMAWFIKGDGITLHTGHFGKELCIEVTVDPDRCLYNPYVEASGNIILLTPSNDISAVAACFMAFIEGYECCYNSMRE